MVVCMAFNDHDLLVSSMSSFASIGTIFERLSWISLCLLSLGILLLMGISTI